MIDDSTSMSGLTLDEASLKAIRHVLGQIRDNPAVAWHFGVGTETFALLTEAEHRHTGYPLKTVREKFLPPSAKDPREPEPLGRMTRERAREAVIEIRGKLSFLQSLLEGGTAGPVESDLESLAEDCGIPADHIRTILHITRDL